MRKYVKLSGEYYESGDNVANGMVGYEERRKRNHWYDKECQVKTKERNKAQIKMLNRATRMNTEN
jgi:hypothetical protein